MTHKSLSLISEDTNQPQHVGEREGAVHRNEHFEEIHCSILMLSKVSESILSSSGAVGRDDGRSGPERNVQLRKEQKKRDSWRRKDRIAEEKKRKGGKKKIGAELQCRQLSIEAASAHANGLPECLQVTSLQRRGFPHRMMSSLYIPPPFFSLTVKFTFSAPMLATHMGGQSTCRWMRRFQKTGENSCSLSLSGNSAMM